jgi:hypothetical protein
MAMAASDVAASVSARSAPSGSAGMAWYIANEPRQEASRPRMGVDQQARRPTDSASSWYGAQRGSVAMSEATTGSRRYIALPQEPAFGPISEPLICAT